MARQSEGMRKLPRHLPLFISLVVVLAVSLHFCLWKSGMFIDEIYTYGLSNSSYMPFIGNGGADGDHDRIPEQTLTREDFEGIRDIIDALLDEGPVPGISGVEDAEQHLRAFLKHAETLGRDDRDQEVVAAVKAYLESN